MSQEYFHRVQIKTAPDLILEQIRGLIRNGKLKPGDRLPSERVLEKKFGVGRGAIREAIKKLEFYGILRVEPMKGTIVASLGVQALEGLISNVLQIDSADYQALFETRTILEINAARLAAVRAEHGDLVAIEVAHEKFKRKRESRDRGLEEDHLFHLKIAEISGNSILTSLIALITPDMIKMNIDNDNTTTEEMGDVIVEHENIITSIVVHDQHAAAQAMSLHMQRSYERRFGTMMKTEFI